MKTTSNYDLFKLVGHNRPVKTKHVENLSKSIRANGYFSHCPIVVARNQDGSTFKIIDGQHRFFACRNIGLPILYEEIRADSANESIIAMNSNQRSWTLEDYLRYYVGEGRPDYAEVQLLCKKYGLAVSSIIQIFNGNNGVTSRGSTSRNISRIFKDGGFFLDEERRKHFARVISMVDDIRGYSALYDGFFSAPTFVKALVRFTTNKDYNHDSMMGCLAERSALLVKSPNYDTYLRLLSNIYNYKRKNRVNF